MSSITDRYDRYHTAICSTPSQLHAHEPAQVIHQDFRFDRPNGHTLTSEFLPSEPNCSSELPIGFAPPFKKLKNPILRKAVAKVACLQQVAAVGGVSVHELVNELRAAVGQEAISLEQQANGRVSYFSDRLD